MQTGPRSNSDLQDLLAQLGRFLSANENRISAAQVSSCFQHLSANEISALHRLFFWLYQNKRTGIHRLPGAKGQQRSTKTPSTGRKHRQWPEREGGSDSVGHQPPQTHLPSSPPSVSADRDACSGDGLVTSISQGSSHNYQIATSMCYSEQAAPCQQPSCTPNAIAGLPVLSLGPLYQHDANAFQDWVDHDSCGNSRLSACAEIKLAPSTQRLLENCKTNPAQFLGAIKEAQVVFPNGQGWEAALATKKENTDIRDLMRIYHRFECYNIYRHVVEAGFHTGTHWVRERRSDLIKKLCQEFPNRFQNQKAANKCLNWVDQGCKYHEWSKIFGKAEDLGYLIALPSDMPHSAYTSRCTREQMNATAIKFKELGISKLVVDLELTRLGNHIASALREMTAKKQRHISEEMFQGSRETMQLNSFPGACTTVRTGQNMTPPESIVPSADEDAMFFDSNATGCPVEYEFACQSTCTERPMSQLLESLSPINDWYQYLHATEGNAVRI
ncbi:hypothetical protein LI328DRAFT_160682 [Trichoderma asperelloides]|nr:hypothetical protein LI328DRAFT_160682 [Trichoderma asperelloides]